MFRVLENIPVTSWVLETESFHEDATEIPAKGCKGQVLMQRNCWSHCSKSHYSTASPDRCFASFKHDPTRIKASTPTAQKKRRAYPSATAQRPALFVLVASDRSERSDARNAPFVAPSTSPDLLLKSTSQNRRGRAVEKVTRCTMCPIEMATRGCRPEKCLQ